MEEEKQKQAGVNEKKQVPTPAGKKHIIREYAESIIIAIILALVIRTFVVQAFKIPSGSMEDTLAIGDHILVSKFIYGVKIPYLNTVLLPLKDPQRGDIVVFKFPLDPKKDFIKRVVGLPGDVVEVREKAVYVNQKRVNQDFTVFSDPRSIPGNVRPRDNLGPVTVPKDGLFVMGDNRDESFDSRFWGFVPLRDVSGKAFIIYWSWDSDDMKVRWGRLARLLH
jgi:signal peptidase I